jgi:hypothetical protein
MKPPDPMFSLEAQTCRRKVATRTFWLDYRNANSHLRLWNLIVMFCDNVLVQQLETEGFDLSILIEDTIAANGASLRVRFGARYPYTLIVQNMIAEQ